LLDIALYALTVGRAHLGLALAASERSVPSTDKQRHDARTADARFD